MLRSIVLLSWLAVMAGAVPAPYGEQWLSQVHIADVEFVDGRLLLIGNTDKQDVIGEQCWTAEVRFQEDKAIVAEWEPSANAICRAMAKLNSPPDQTDAIGLPWVVGDSILNNGIIDSLAPDDANYYNFAMQLEWNDVEVDVTPVENNTTGTDGVRYLRGHERSLEEGDTAASNVTAAGTYDYARAASIVQGLVVNNGTEKHTLRVAANQNHVYTLSLEYNEVDDLAADENDLTKIPPTDYYTLPGDPTADLLKGWETSRLVVRGFKRVEDVNATTTDEIPSFGEQEWIAILAPDDYVAVASDSGLYVHGDNLFVTGSTPGGGEAFGVNGNGTDMDGFVVKLSRTDGHRVGSTNETDGEVSTLRISTQEGADDYVYDICGGAGRIHDHVFAVGSTTGNFNGLADSSNVTKAFLVRIQISTMEVVDAVQFPTVEDTYSVGLSCELTPDGEHVYVAGQVEGGLLEGVTGGGGGKSDVFVAKVEVNDTLPVTWIAQFGSHGPDVFGGLVVTEQGNAIVAGNTLNGLYREKASESLEFFVAVLSLDGEVPEQITPLDSNVTAPTELEPTMPTTESPPTTELPPATSTVPPPPSMQTFNFVQLAIRFEGVGRLSSQAKLAFEQVTEEFYRDVYSADRRRLQGFDVSDFSTVVTYVEQDHDDNGNTIQYHQTIAFRSTDGTITEEQAQEIIRHPFKDTSRAAEYITLLQQQEPEFAGASSVETPLFREERNDNEPSNTEPPTPSSSDDDEGFDIMLIIYIAGGVVLCCCCCGIARYCKNRRERAPLMKDTDDDFHSYNGENMVNVPEQPLECDGDKSVISSHYGMSAVGEDFFEDEATRPQKPSEFDRPDRGGLSNRHEPAELSKDLGLEGMHPEESKEESESESESESDSESGSDSDSDDSEGDYGSDYSSSDGGELA